MSLWIKICGNTSLGDARIAVEAGADALGFVFAPSPRQVTPSEVAAIASHLPVRVEKIGVFVDAALEEIYEAVRMCGLTGVQLHWEAPVDLPEKLHRRLGAALRILRVVHFGSDAQASVASISADPHVYAWMVDSRTAEAVGGTGMAFDWAAAKALFPGNLGTRRMIAAGGLRPENVSQAIAMLRPWGVDVVSGVEAAPGRKDAARVREFVARARAASSVTGESSAP